MARFVDFRSSTSLRRSGSPVRLIGPTSWSVSQLCGPERAAHSIKFPISCSTYWNNGFSWLNRGYEFTLLWGMVAFAIALRGGGPYSLDRKLGTEL